MLISTCSYGAVARRLCEAGCMCVCECVRFGDHGTADSAERSESSFCASFSSVAVQVRICLWCACSWKCKNTFSCGSPPGTQHTGDATPVQRMLNLFSMDSQWDVKLGSLNYPWSCMRDGKVQWQHQSLSLLGPNRDIVIRKQLNAKQIKKEMASPGTFSQVPA